jgi:hypothetical protein
MQRHGTHSDAVDEAFDEYHRAALSEYSQKQKAFAERTSAVSRWTIDNEALTLTFHNEEGDGFTASFVPVATYLPSQSSWAWVWTNDAYSDRARVEASRLKELTSVTGYKIFSSPSFDAEPHEIDELCALSLKHLGARAIFKIKDDEPWLLVAIK